MFETLYYTLQVLAIIMLVVSMIPQLKGRGWVLSLVAMFLFFYLGFASYNIQTEDCSNNLANTTLTSNVTVYAYNECTINSYQDTVQGYFNYGLVILSLVFTLGLWFRRALGGQE